MVKGGHLQWREAAAVYSVIRHFLWSELLTGKMHGERFSNKIIISNIRFKPQKAAKISSFGNLTVIPT